MIIFILIFIAGLANGMMDYIKFHSKSEHWFWGRDSWMNIYKNSGTREQKFFLSKSVLAFVCDGWHLMKFIMIESLMLALVLSCDKCESLFSYTVIYILYRLIYWIGFEITWK